MNNGPIIDSHATGDVSGATWVGGLVGENNGAGGVNRISGSTAGGAVTGTGDLAGGLVGLNNGPIIDSHATGDVSGATWVGGLVGKNEGAGGVNRINGSTAAGTVTATGTLVGGLVGLNNGPISDSDARGARVRGLDTCRRSGRVRTLAVDNGDGANTISRSTASAAVEGTALSGSRQPWRIGRVERPARSAIAMPVAVYREGLRVAGWSGGTVARSQTAVRPVMSVTRRVWAQSVGGLVGVNKGGAVIRESRATGDVTSTRQHNRGAGRAQRGYDHRERCQWRGDRRWVSRRVGRV